MHTYAAFMNTVVVRVPHVQPIKMINATGGHETIKSIPVKYFPGSPLNKLSPK